MRVLYFWGCGSIHGRAFMVGVFMAVMAVEVGVMPVNERGGSTVGCGFV